MYSRRTFLKISASITALVAGSYFFKSSGVPKVKHILSSASHERLGITLSLSKTTSKLELLLNGSNLIKGRKTDKEGKHWQFLSNKLISNESYELQLISENEPIYKIKYICENAKFDKKNVFEVESLYVGGGCTCLI